MDVDNKTECNETCTPQQNKDLLKLLRLEEMCSDSAFPDCGDYDDSTDDEFFD